MTGARTMLAAPQASSSSEADVCGWASCFLLSALLLCMHACTLSSSSSSSSSSAGRHPCWRARSHESVCAGAASSLRRCCCAPCRPRLFASALFVLPFFSCRCEHPSVPRPHPQHAAARTRITSDTRLVLRAVLWPQQPRRFIATPNSSTAVAACAAPQQRRQITAA